MKKNLTLREPLWVAAGFTFLALCAIAWNQKVEHELIERSYWVVDFNSADRMSFLPGDGATLPEEWLTQELYERLDELRRQLATEIVRVRMMPAQGTGSGHVAVVDAIHKSGYSAHPHISLDDNLLIDGLAGVQITATRSGKRWIVETSKHAMSEHPEKLVEVFTAVLNHTDAVKGFDQAGLWAD